MSDAKLIAIKHSMCQTLSTAYQTFLQAVMNLPAHEKQREYAFKAFDEGSMWLQQGIINSSLEYKNLDVESLDGVPHGSENDAIPVQADENSVPASPQEVSAA